MSFASAELAWNSVDVRGNDGLLHNGRVIDAVDGGLIVHFGGSGYSGARLVHFDDIYFRHYSRYLSSVGTRFDKGPETLDRSVEVLLRLNPEDPWKWYPGMVLHGFGLVSVTLPDRELKGVAVEQRIRERSTDGALAGQRVVEGQFSRKMVVVPSEVAAASDEQVIAVFNEYCRQHGYTKMARYALISDSEHHGPSRELTVLELDDVHFDWPDSFGMIRIRACQHPLDKLLMSALKGEAVSLDSKDFPSPALFSCEGDIQSLYRDLSIFLQIFQCLTTLQQNELRAVCKTWDTLLMSAGVRRLLTVSLSDAGEDYTNEQYRFASCLYNCWTPQTKTLTLWNGAWNDELTVGFFYQDQLEFIAHLLLCTMAAKGLSPTGTLLLAGRWFFLGRTSNWVNALCESFAALMRVGQQVVLKKITVHVNVELNPLTQSTVYWDQYLLAVRFSNQHLTRQLTANNFWAVLNNGPRDLDPSVVERLGKLISGSAALPSTRSAQIAQILNITQTLDTREGVRYRGMSFDPVGDAVLGVDVRFLTKLTLHLLHQLQNGENFVIDI